MNGSVVEISQRTQDAGGLEGPLAMDISPFVVRFAMTRISDVMLDLWATATLLDAQSRVCPPFQAHFSVLGIGLSVRSGWGGCESQAVRLPSQGRRHVMMVILSGGLQCTMCSF